MKLLAGLLALLCLSGAARAAETDVLVFRLELVQVNDEGYARLSGQSRLPQGFTGKVLHSAELMGSAGKECLFFLGHKSPVVYYDPRNSQFQIQYVDSGVKFDMKCKTDADQTYRLEVRPEVSVIESNKVVGVAPNTMSYPQTTLFTTQTELALVHLGDSMIVGRSHGTAARRFLESVGGGLPAGGENVITVITVNRL